MPNGSFLRVASLLPCLALAACMVTGEPDAASPPAAAPAASAAASPRSASTPSTTWGGGGARGGASTAAARAEPVEVGPDILTQARADCWMKVEAQKGLRDIDRRSMAGVGQVLQPSSRAAVERDRDPDNAVVVFGGVRHDSPTLPDLRIRH